METWEKQLNLIYFWIPSNSRNLAHSRCLVSLWWGEGNTEKDDPCLHSLLPLFCPSHFTRESYQNAHLTVSFLPSNLCLYIVQGSLGCIHAPLDLSPANFFCLIPQHSLSCTSHSATSWGVPESPCFHDFTWDTANWTIPILNHTRNSYSNLKIPLRHHSPKKRFPVFPTFSPPISTTWVDSILHLLNQQAFTDYVLFARPGVY